MSAGQNHHYKLTYFDVRARAEPARLILVYAGQKFDNNRIHVEDWAELKPKTPFGQIPVLDVDHGKFVISQSTSIARYLAEKFGLAGKSDKEKGRVNELLDWHNDIFNQVMSYPSIKSGFPNKLDEKAAHEIFSTVLKEKLPLYQKLIKKSKSGFLVDSGVTFVDFFVADFLFTVKGLEPELVDGLDELLEYIEKVNNLPKIKEYVENRKQTIE